MRRGGGARIGALLLLIASSKPAPSAGQSTAGSLVEARGGVNAAAVGLCSSLLDSAAVFVRRNEFEPAEHALLTAGERCADRAAVMIELAAVRFQQRRYVDAAQLAERVLAVDNRRVAGWDLLASSRYLIDDHDGALRAWNRIGRPRNAGTQIEGIASSRSTVVHDAVAIRAGALVTDAALARARRRVAALPAVLHSRVDYRPVRGGDVEVQAAIVERPVLPLSLPDLLAHGVRALAGSRLRVDVASAFTIGEAWLLDWVWQRNRRAIELGFAAPGVFGTGGVWQVDVADRTLSYRLMADSAVAGTAGAVRRDHDRAVTLSLADWITRAVRWQLSGSVEHWTERGPVGGLSAEVQLRGLSDRLALRVARGGWWSFGAQQTYHTFDIEAAIRSSSVARSSEWNARAGIARASDSIPRTRWSGAGNDLGTYALLRAHRLIDGDGITDGALFGPRLLHAGIELRRWLPRLGPIQVGVAAFADGASVRAVANDLPARTALDIGAGMRLRAAGLRGTIRADAAIGVVDRASALSLGWQPPWPEW